MRAGTCSAVPVWRHIRLAVSDSEHDRTAEAWV